jgi:hypothetical protein
MNDDRVVSAKFPYIPVHIQIRQRITDVEALLDTGFDGDVVVPPGLSTGGQAPTGYEQWTLADGRVVTAPYYAGTGGGAFGCRGGAFARAPLVAARLAHHPPLVPHVVNEGTHSLILPNATNRLPALS